MIVVDASAVLAIYFDEYERVSFVRRMEQEGDRIISAINLFECHLRAARLPNGQTELEATLELLRLRRAPQEADTTGLVDAHRRFGKGRHPAGLNLGDCFAYALARQHDAPLLFKGEDFRHTDVRCAL